MGIEALVNTIEQAHAAAARPITVGVSGFGGSGKTTLAKRLVSLIPDSIRIRGDDFLDPVRSHRRSADWDGVDRERLVRDVLLPFRERRPSQFQRFDWSNRTLGAPEALPSGEVLVVDLIGLFHPETEAALDLRIWCDVDLETATERGVARDVREGHDHTALWHDVWVPNERDFEAHFDPRARADVLVPTQTPDY